jgi:hypothetical protein
MDIPTYPIEYGYYNYLLSEITRPKSLEDVTKMREKKINYLVKKFKVTNRSQFYYL